MREITETCQGCGKSVDAGLMYWLIFTGWICAGCYVKFQEWLEKFSKEHEQCYEEAKAYLTAEAMVKKGVL